MKRYKFQALVTPRSSGDGDALTGKGPASQRVVVRARNSETRRYAMFRALLDSGTFGYCEETDQPIGIRRLEARPIATLSIEAQERHERMERTYRDE